MHRGGGLGEQLVLAAEAWAREFGCHSAWLDYIVPGETAHVILHAAFGLF